ncbi:MAG: SDR family oxidoreductase [Vicinamibacteria bacterium]|nr:SDR family oxidoreductase [Vicinamibacteria bacterium]
MPTRRDVIKAAGLVAVGFGSGSAGAAQAPRPSRVPVPAATSVTPAPRPLRILILGGTGFIGPNQVRYALARGHELTLFNRGRNPKDWPGEVEELTGDRNTGDLASLKGRTWDVCIDNPTTLPFWVRDAGTILKGQVGHYIFVSTLSVYSDNRASGEDESGALFKYQGTDEEVMKETQESVRKNMGNLYGPLKARSEKEAEKWFPGITTIVRPGLIVGPGDETDRFTYWPVRLDRGGDVLAPGDGSDAVQFIDTRDLSEWMIRLAEAKVFGTFNAMGPGFELTMQEMLLGIRAATTAGARLRWAPADFLEKQKVSAWSDMPVWVPGGGEDGGFSRRSNKKAMAAGLTFRPLAQTALDTLAWFKSLPAERQTTLKAGIKPEREKEVLAALAAESRTAKKIFTKP